jgi:hypothetical protein
MALESNAKLSGTSTLLVPTTESSGVGCAEDGSQVLAHRSLHIYRNRTVNLHVRFIYQVLASFPIIR